MRIGIYGAGSLGTVLGAYLTKSGVPVELINRNKAHVAALQKNGAHITGMTELLVPVDARLPEEMEGVYDLLFLMTKQLYNHDVVTGLLPFLGETGVICTLQNGIPEPGIAEIIGRERVCGCTVAWGATLQGPGVAELTTPPESMTFGMGDMGGFPHEKLMEIKAVLEHMCPVELEENFMGVRWSKLLINAVFSGMGTVVGGTFGDAVDDPVSRRCCQLALKECVETGHAAGVAFAPVQGKDIVKLFDYRSGLKRWLSFQLLPLAIKKHRAIKPSMLQDLEKGKKCEIDAINGVVCAFGRQYGVPTPVNDKIVEIVKACQSGERKPGKENLAAFHSLYRG